MSLLSPPAPFSSPSEKLIPSLSFRRLELNLPWPETDSHRTYHGFLMDRPVMRKRFQEWLRWKVAKFEETHRLAVKTVAPLSFRTWLDSFLTLSEDLVFSTDVSLPHLSLCRICKAWNNPQHLFNIELLYEDPRVVTLGSLLQGNTCSVCQLISAVVMSKMQMTDTNPQNASDIRVLIGPAFLFPNRGILESDSPTCGRKQLKCVLWLQIHENPYTPPPTDPRVHPSIGLQLLLSYEGKSHPLLTRIAVWDGPYFNTRLVKAWINDCMHNHGDKCINISTRVPTGLRLIDVKQICIVEASESSRFVALSYRWPPHIGGKNLELKCENVLQLQQVGGLDLKALPDIIVDAIQLCSDLKERYLWVDRLCIIQDDKDSKHNQISAMDQIYGAAVFTIVGAVDATKSSGLPGVRGRPRNSHIHNRSRLFDGETVSMRFNFKETVENCDWNTRGWTFQERILSTRCLYISEHQAYFSCPRMIQQEELGWDYRRRDFHFPEIRTVTPSGLHEVGPYEFTHSYFNFVVLYTARTLSYEADVLNAFTGVSNALERQSETRFIFGHPERFLAQSMLWQTTDHGKPRQQTSYIPSWSWASWSGPVGYKEVELADTGRLVDLYVQDSEQGLRPVMTQNLWFSQARDFRACKILIDQSNHGPGRLPKWVPKPEVSNSIWLKCPHNPLETLEHTALDDVACSLAAKRPGSLVFNTTIGSVFLMPNKEDRSQPLDRQHWLLDAQGERIGVLHLDREMAKCNIDPRRPQYAIVLCAGLSDQRVRYYERQLKEYPWLLKVMLIDQIDGRSHRLGVGFIRANLWQCVDPKWETIVLF